MSQTSHKPASRDELVDRLTILFAALPSQDKGAAEDLRAQAYLFAMEGVSLPVLDAVMADALQGRLDGVDHRFVPTPPQLAAACRDKRASMLRASLDSHSNVVRLPPPPELTEAEKERRAAKVARVMAELDAATANMEMRA